MGLEQTLRYATSISPVATQGERDRQESPRVPLHPFHRSSRRRAGCAGSRRRAARRPQSQAGDGRAATRPQSWRSRHQRRHGAGQARRHHSAGAGRSHRGQAAGAGRGDERHDRRAGLHQHDADRRHLARGTGRHPWRRRRLWAFAAGAGRDGQCRICLGQSDRSHAYGPLPRRGGGRRAGDAAGICGSQGDPRILYQ